MPIGERIRAALRAALLHLVFSALVASQRNFDKLNSGLITMTGSAENAAKAFSVLQQFAKETPYGLNQAVEGFTKLVALGLNPSKEALISYGNTAADLHFNACRHAPHLDAHAETYRHTRTGDRHQHAGTQQHHQY